MSASPRPRGQTPRQQQRAKVLGLMAKAGKRSKYRAVRCEVDGEKFDSKREARAFQALNTLMRRGMVRSLTRQVVFPLVVNGQHVCAYIADFVFEENGPQHGGPSWTLVVADSKGVRTRDYLLKKKLMKAVHGIEIREL